MAITVRDDLVIPEVISGIVVTDALYLETPLLRSPYVVDVANEANGVYYGDGGDHIKFLARKYDEDVDTPRDYVQDMVRTSKTGVTGKKIRLTSYSENIVDKTTSIEFDEWGLKDCARQGNIEQFMANVIAQGMAEEMHAALMTQAGNTDLEYDATAAQTKTLTVDTILAAKMKWGDKVVGKRPGLYISSKQFTDLATSNTYLTLATAGTTSIVTAEEMANGAVAVVHGVVLYLCDSVPSAAGSPATYTGKMLLPRALGLLIKDVKVRPPARFTGTSVFQLDADLRYTTTLFRENPRPAVNVKTQ